MLFAEETFRRLAIGGPGLSAELAELDDRDPPAFQLDDRTESLVRVAVLVTLDAPQSSYQGAVEAAIRAGASLDDLIATLLAIKDFVGSPRVVSAAPRIALAAGYDVDAALEATDPDRR
jgi:alkylhydroperoxidase/carboxymuconolactone decarboxylase family protein YurZ